MQNMIFWAVSVSWFTTFPFLYSKRCLLLFYVFILQLIRFERTCLMKVYIDSQATNQRMHVCDSGAQLNMPTSNDGLSRRAVCINHKK